MKTKKRAKSPRRQLAERLISDPKSPTFLKKTESLIKAGYTEQTALAYPQTASELINFTDILPKGLKSPQEFAKRCYTVLFKLVKELEDAPKLTKVSAKYIGLIYKTLELLKDMFGMKRPEVKRTESVQIIGIPQQKCPECGHIMDYMKE